MTLLIAAPHAVRLARVRAAMVEAGLPAIYTTHPANRRYLSGYTGEDHPPTESAGALLITPDAAYLHTSALNATQAREQAPDFTIVPSTLRTEATDQLREIAACHAITRLGVEEDVVRYAVYRWLRETLINVELIDIGALIGNLRAIKDADEIALLRRAQAITVAAFVDVSRRITVGMTEKQVAWDWKWRCARTVAMASASPSLSARASMGRDRITPSPTVRSAQASQS